MNLEKSYLIKKLFYLVLIISILPFLYLFLDNSVYESYLSKTANITGFIGAVLVIWQFFLGIRGVVKRFNPDYDWAMKIHAFLGIYGSIFIFLHPILLAIDRNNTISYMLLLNFSNEYETYVSYGKIAMFLFLVLWFTSSLVRKSLSYRSWLYIHYISYPMLFFVLLHPFQIGSYLQEFSFIYTYWILLCISAVLFMILKLLDIFNLSFNKFRITNLTNLNKDIYTITYKPVNEKFSKIKPGQYFYLKKNFFGEAHPYSILEYNDFTGEITFGIKKLGKSSTLLGESKIGDIHFIDGPFGEFTFEAHNEDPKVILAGGIGITPFYEVLTRYGNDQSYLLYANKDLESALYRDKFKELLNERYFDFVEKLEGEKRNVFSGYISSEKISEILKNKDLSSIRYFICGSPGFTKGMIDLLKNLGIKRNKIFIEEFEY